MSAGRCGRARIPAGARAQRGYSLVEMMVAIVIALFLIGGVIMIEQTVSIGHRDNGYLAQVDDDERFAVTLLSELGQRAGYYAHPTINSLVSALPALAVTASPDNAALTFQAGQSVFGTTDANGDAIAIRYMAATDGSIPLCDGQTPQSNDVYVNYLYLESAPAIQGIATPNYYLDCITYDTNTKVWGSPTRLVRNVKAMQVSYGVNTNVGGTAYGGEDEYNVDTYVPTADMAGAMSAYWNTVASMDVVLEIYNPLGYIHGVQQAGQPVDFRITTLVDIMNRAGPHL